MNRPTRKAARALLLVGAVAALLPAEARAYVNAGFRSQAEYDRYLQEQKRLVRPRDPSDFYYRGCSLGSTGEWRAAIADFNEAIRLSPEFAAAFVARGTVRWKREEYAMAIADYQQAVRLDPRAVPAHLRLAAAYASCPTATLRSPAKAMASAKRACELSGYRDRDSVQVLAALHAQAGNFEAAVKWQTRAVTMNHADEKAKQPGLAGAVLEAGRRVTMNHADEKAKQLLEQYRGRKTPEWNLEKTLTGPPVLGERE
jgi:tetratricopeptide (TPR) repeat protein